MTNPSLVTKAENYLKYLCLDVPTRRVGSQGNQDANEFLADTFASFGFNVERQSFECIDWNHGAASLSVNGEPFQIKVGPFTLGCHVQAPLVIASSVEELALIDAFEKILMLRGELTREQLMPKNFPFFNPEEHKRIISLLESKKPLAVLAATTRSPASAGAVYPFPLIEDGDFDIPSAYMTEEEGARLASHAGDLAALVIQAERRPSSGFNLAAYKGRPNRRIVFSAHIDSKDDTPGALDNAAGVVVLLLLAELLKEYDRGTGIEFVPFNGEDHYSAAGEIAYLKANEGRLDQVMLNINMDGLGSRKGKVLYSYYGCSDDLKNRIQNSFATQPHLAEGEPWFQGDHMVFAMIGIPSLAMISENFIEILTEIAHTPKDSPDLVDCGKLVKTARALQDLLGTFS